MLTTLADYRLIANSLDASLERIAGQPDVKREADHYLSRIENIGTIDAFLADDRVYRFAMQASGLDDMIYAKAFMRKVLEEGVESPDSFANQLADTRFRDFARRFNFHSYGATATTFTRARQGVVDDYLRLRLEKQAGESNEGVRLALYFQRKAGTIHSGYDILADRALLKVAETILGYPLSRGNIDHNARLVEKTLDLPHLGQPGALDRLLSRFATMWEMNGASASPAFAPNALITGSFGIGMDQNILLTLQNLRISGG